MDSRSALIVAAAVLLAAGMLVGHQHWAYTKQLALQARATTQANAQEAMVQTMARQMTAMKSSLETMTQENAKLKESLATLSKEVGRRPLADDGVSPVPALAKLMEHENSSVRSYATRCLGYLGGEEAEAVLLASLKRPGRERYASYALESLARMKSNRIGSVVQQMLAEGNENERRAAVSVLNSNTYIPIDKPMVDTLLRILETEKGTDNSSMYTRQYLCSALGRSGDPRACGAILKAIKDTRRRTSNDSYRDRYMIQALLACARGQAQEVEWLCQALEAIRPSLKASSSHLSSHYLIPAIGEIGDKRATPFLLPFLNSANKQEVEDAVLALGLLRDPLAAPGLCNAFAGATGDAKKTLETILKKNYPGVTYDPEGKRYVAADEATLKALKAKRDAEIKALKERRVPAKPPADDKQVF